MKRVSVIFVVIMFLGFSFAAGIAPVSSQERDTQSQSRTDPEKQKLSKPMPIGPLIEVISPIQTDNWELGSLKQIKWIWKGQREIQVRFILVQNNQILGPLVPPDTTASQLTKITARELNWKAGEYLLGATSKQAFGDNFIIRILDTRGTVLGESAAFRIGEATTTPEIKLLTPANGAIWTRESRQKISWQTSAMAGKRLKISLFQNDKYLGRIAWDIPSELTSLEWVVGHITLDNGHGRRVSLGDRYSITIQTMDKKFANTNQNYFKIILR